jgi:tetratricopeptide (TPR) repeat protein
MRVAALAGVLLCALVPLRSQNGDVERAIESIQDAMENGDRASASRMLTDALARYPREAGLLNLRGVMHAQQSELAEARADFQQAVQLSPGLTPAWQNLARACQIVSERDAAAMSCAAGAWERVLRARPADAEAMVALATVYEWQGKFADSLRELEKLPPGEAVSPGVLALRCGDLAGLRRAPEAAQAAETLAGAADFSEADAASIFPVLESTRNAGLIVKLVESLDARGKASTDSLARLAVAYEQLNRLPDARLALERVSAADPKNPRHLLELARVAHLSHDLEGCLAYLGHARDLTPDDARIHFLFGLVSVEMELPVEARRSLDKALAIDPKNPDYNFAMGSLLLNGGRATESLPYLTRYVAARPGDPKGQFALGAAYFDNMDYEECRKEMLGIAKGAKTEAGAAYFLGRVARVEENFDEARAELNRAIKLLPAFGEAHTELARVYLALGELAAARAAVDHAISLDSDNYQANQVLLAILERSHDSGAEKQAARLETLDAERSRRRELLRRTIEVKPY